MDSVNDIDTTAGYKKLGELLDLLHTEQAKMAILDRWWGKDHDQPKLPHQASEEAKALATMAVTEWPRLAVNTVAQLLRVEGIQSAERPTEPIWLPWQRNAWQRRQIPCFKAALAYGQAFGTALPGVGSRAVLRAYSPMEALAVYGDDMDDDWPQFFIRELVRKDGSRLIRVIDTVATYFFEGAPLGGRVQPVERRPHDLGFCPVVRFANDMDLQGRTPGEIEPLIPIAKRINKTDFDRLLAQHYNSWKVKWATGLDDLRTDQEREQYKMRLAQEDVLIGAAGTEFGTLDQTVLDGFVTAKDSDIEAFAAVSQTPPTTYGKIVNVSAEGLAAARASLYAKRDERQMTFGESACQLLRAASAVEGRMEDAGDYTLSPKWADTDIQTIAGAVDALGKAASLLGIPPELWGDRRPSVDPSTAREWLAYLEAHPTPDRLAADAEARAAVAAEAALAAAVA
jgi:hypothetical protein